MASACATTDFSSAADIAQTKAEAVIGTASTVAPEMEPEEMMQKVEDQPPASDDGAGEVAAEAALDAFAQYAAGEDEDEEAKKAWDIVAQLAEEADKEEAKTNPQEEAAAAKEEAPTPEAEEAPAPAAEEAPAEAEAPASSEAPAALAPMTPEKKENEAGGEQASGSGELNKTPVQPFPNPVHYVDMSYINTRTADPDNVRGEPRGQTTTMADLGASPSVKKEDGKWSVDVSYINSRTKDPNRLEARRSLAPAQTETGFAAAKKSEEGWNVNMSHIDSRTKDPEILRRGTGAGPKVEAGFSAAKKSEEGWSVNMSHIDSRTKDPEILRRNTAAGPKAVTSFSAAKKSEEGWSVDMSHIDSRTKDLNRLSSRRSVGGPGVADFSGASSTVKKLGDGKWSVDTSYIDRRTADPNCLEARRRSMLPRDANQDSEEPGSPPARTKEADGKWRQVATPHIGLRTSDVENIANRRASVSGSGPSATVSRGACGSWKVDTSYIGHRTADPDNLRQSEKANETAYADPTEKKYGYEQLKSADRPSDVNPATKELYLADDEFQLVFAMEPADFAKMPRWKQLNLKKAKGLY
eukprot:TRINITY_DN1675_c0_g1_i1.p1 TRINITY_DN1675_c0_g1~~TRINITY_DN1675_c0_g1_i1.p1  ORF type:complete len:582 (-),score=177.52 TRINITY_DN1675_c0_g1_i1:363-2108(-)